MMGKMFSSKWATKDLNCHIYQQGNRKPNNFDVNQGQEWNKQRKCKSGQRKCEVGVEDISHMSCFHAVLSCHAVIRPKIPPTTNYFYNAKLSTPALPPPLFHVSIVLISLTPALSTIFIKTDHSDRSIVRAIPFKVTRRSAVVVGLKTNPLVPTLLRLPCLFWKKSKCLAL